MTRTARTQASGEVGMAAGQVLESATELSREAETLRSEVTRFLAGVPVHLPRGPAGVRAEAAALVVALLPRPAHASYQPAKVLTFAGWYSLCLARRRPGPTRRAIPPGESQDFRRAVSALRQGREESRHVVKGGAAQGANHGGRVRQVLGRQGGTGHGEPTGPLQRGGPPRPGRAGQGVTGTPELVHIRRIRILLEHARQPGHILAEHVKHEHQVVRLEILRQLLGKVV